MLSNGLFLSPLVSALSLSICLSLLLTHTCKDTYHRVRSITIHTHIYPVILCSRIGRKLNNGVVRYAFFCSELIFPYCVFISIHSDLWGQQSKKLCAWKEIAYIHSTSSKSMTHANTKCTHFSIAYKKELSFSLSLSLSEKQTWWTQSIWLIAINHQHSEKQDTYLDRAY